MKMLRFRSVSRNILRQEFVDEVKLCPWLLFVGCLLTLLQAPDRFRGIRLMYLDVGLTSSPSWPHPGPKFDVSNFWGASFFHVSTWRQTTVAQAEISLVVLLSALFEQLQHWVREHLDHSGDKVGVSPGPKKRKMMGIC